MAFGKKREEKEKAGIAKGKERAERANAASDEASKKSGKLNLKVIRGTAKGHGNRKGGK